MSRRKAEMVLKLVDKASRPARRFIAMQRRMGQASERANRLSKRTAAAAKGATELYTQAVQRLDRAQDALRTSARRTNRAIEKQISRLKTSATYARNGIAKVGQAAVVGGAVTTAYVGTLAAAGVALLGPARQFERFQTVLRTTEGSSKAAQDAMKWVETFAVKTPYELDQVMESFVQLRAYGLDPTNGMLKTLGDASAAMNKPLMQSVEAMADAVTGENERLKELGIKASKVGKHFEYSYTGSDGSDKVVRALASDRQAIQAAILGIFNERYDGAMDNLSKTFDGLFSNLLDQWSKFQRMIMGFGVFDWMKSKLKLVLDEINRLEASGELAQWAKAIADNILIGLEAIWNFGSSAIEFWQLIHPYLQAAADALGGWRNLALAVLAIPLRGFIFGAAAGLVQFAWAAVLASRALVTIGFASAASGAMRLGAVLLALLNPFRWLAVAALALRGALLALRLMMVLTFRSMLILGRGLLLLLNPFKWVQAAALLFRATLLGTMRVTKAAGVALLAMRLPLNALKAAFVALRVAIVATGIGALVVGLAMAGTWIYNNWSGLVSFFKGFGETFMASLGPARPLVQGIVDAASKLWGWISALTGPLDASAQTWHQWGQSAGEALGAAVSQILNLPSYLTELSGDLFDKGVEMMQSIWDGMASILTVMVDTISAKLSSIVPDWMRKAWEWSQGTETTESTRTALLANRPGPPAAPPTASPVVASANANADVAEKLSVAVKAARASVLAGAIAAGGTAATAQSNPDGARYVTATRNTSSTVSAPVTLTINGNVDREVLPDLEELADRAAEKVEERIAAAQRWGHD